MPTPKPYDDNLLVNLSTPIRPTSDQERLLTAWHAGLIQTDQALRLPRRRRPSIEAALDRHAPDLPADLRPAVLRVLLARLDRQDASSINLPFDSLFSPFSPYLLHSSVLPGPIIADLWRLPLGLDQALSRDAAVAGARLAAEIRRRHRADTVGDFSAPGRLHDLVVESGIQDAFELPLVSGVSVPAPVFDRSLPHPGRHVVVWCERLPDGTTGWNIRWTIRVRPDWLPQASNSDTVGVDVGVHRAVTWADGQEHGHFYAFSRPTDGLRPTAPATGLSRRLADAHLRHAEFAQSAQSRDQTLRHLLTYRSVALEATQWADLVRKDARGPEVVRNMGMTGVTTLAPWLRALSRVTGTRVMSVPAEGSSLTCHACDHAGQRRGMEFRCPHCGLIADADVNAAQNHRLWGLGHRRDLRVKRA